MALINFFFLLMLASLNLKLGGGCWVFLWLGFFVCLFGVVLVVGLVGVFLKYQLHL